MDTNLLISLFSLGLSIFFWWNARQQTELAERLLQDIKSQIIGWQNELNKTAIEMLSSRPEMIAKQTAMAESDAAANFTNTLAETIRRLSENSTPDNQKMIDSLLAHHAGVLQSKQDMFQSAIRATGLNK